jgi:hypothetical protein
MIDSDKKDDFLHSFSRSLLNKNATIFCGAGLSIPSGLPSWDILLKKMRKELELPNSFQDLPLLAQYYVAHIAGGRQVLEETIRKSLSLEYEPNINHYLISKLPLDEIWTTNYDTLIEQVITNHHVFSTDESLLDDKRFEDTAIIKIHGNIPKNKKGTFDKDNSKDIIITREDFENYSLNFPRLWTKLHSTFVTKSILFLGLSFNDPNLNLILSLARTRYYNANKKHYTIIKKPKEKSDLILHNYKMSDLSRSGISVIEIDDYGEQTTLLKELVNKATPPMLFISGSYKSNIIIDQLCDLIGTSLAFKDIGVISGSNNAGKNIGFCLGDKLIELNKYKPEKVIFYFRAIDKEAERPDKRLGSIKFYGNDAEEMRKEILNQVRAVIVVGGESGTLEEVRLAESLQIPIIPIAISGGTAKNYWDKMMNNLDNYSLGGKRILKSDFELLNSSNIVEVANTTSKLLSSAMYL